MIIHKYHYEPQAKRRTTHNTLTKLPGLPSYQLPRCDRYEADSTGLIRPRLSLQETLIERIVRLLFLLGSAIDANPFESVAPCQFGAIAQFWASSPGA